MDFAEAFVLVLAPVGGQMLEHFRVHVAVELVHKLERRVLRRLLRKAIEEEMGPTTLTLDYRATRSIGRDAAFTAKQHQEWENEPRLSRHHIPAPSLHP